MFPLGKFIFNNNTLLNKSYNFCFTYRAPGNLTYQWNFGSIAILILILQFVTGLFLSMHYIPNVETAFQSIEHIMRDINNGWLLRYCHSNGASFFFLIIYLHICRNLIYNSYYKPRHLLWSSGVTLLLLMIIISFLGYVLPWGQMSYWAATVITNLLSTIPLIGNELTCWLWGGFTVDNPTLNRFFSLHFVLPFFLISLVYLHLILLHEVGSNNPIGIQIKKEKDNIPFHPYYTSKDLLGIFVAFIVFTYFVFFEPNLLGHTDNYIQANPCITPEHIVPEWYFLPFYAILRSVPNKLIGVILLLMSIVILYFLPYLNNKFYIVDNYYRPLTLVLNICFICNFILLGWIGTCNIEEPYYTLGQLFTLFYFIYFFFLYCINKGENYLFITKI